MTTKTVWGNGPIARGWSHLDGRSAAARPLEHKVVDAEDDDAYDTEMSLIQSMGQSIGWLSCMLVTFSLLVSGYVMLSVSLKSGGLERAATVAEETALAEIKADGRQGHEEQAQTTVAREKLAPLPELRIGMIFRDLRLTGESCPFCPEMVVVPDGSFVLGAGPGEPWREDWQAKSEAPTTKVTLDQPFAVARFAVTFDQWQVCVIDGDCAATPSDNGWGRANRPVVNVSWREALQYVSWLSAKTGRPYRLLSEAEREYVTRAGTTTAYWFGQEPSPKMANYLWDRTMPVDSLKPNAWGLHHVHGNISEWTADCWNGTHHGHSGRAVARQSGDCKRRVIKGGAWFNSPNLIRSAARAGLDAASRYKTVGFRVARAIEARD